MNSFPLVTLTKGLGALFLRSPIIYFRSARFVPQLYGVFVKFAPFWSWLDPGWFAILSPRLESVHLGVQIQPHRASGVPLGCKLKVSPVRLAIRAILKLLRNPNPDFGPSFPYQLGRLPISQSCFISRSTTRGYTPAVYLCLKDSKDQCGHPIASEELMRVFKYPDGKRAFKIRNCSCGLVWFARASGLFTLTALRGAPEEPASRGLTISLIAKSGSRLVCN
ncbi:hypothetical protein RF11_16174 [Thelohanellus kitauei]|uniref:Uncharacterized protein n=1 Tax=Thelohanellus kitauei TaxID=669202 RepID=A0A0C2J9R0_THEKT|nr:hypothetical protein RF11_16174 [Thelohanellus kitauei]